jgi:hypothetical protein
MASQDPIYTVWHRVRAPFAMPRACHDCSMEDWEVFDVDKAGCVHCGRFHQCRDGGECVSSMDHDHQACEITGCWIRNRNFQQGYTDTAVQTTQPGQQQGGCSHRSHGEGMDFAFSSNTTSTTSTTHSSSSSRQPHHHQPKQWVESAHVARWLHTLVFSDTARQCIAREIQRVQDKATVAFARVAKEFKLQNRPPCMLEMLAHTRFVLGSLRIPCKVTSQQMFDALARECIHAILCFTSCFRKVLMPHVPPAKLDHFVIGLIYLLRSGIVMFDTVQVVPRIPALRRLLPMETSLKLNFRIPCKIITEVENITKTTLKALDRRGVALMMKGAGRG